MATDVSGVSSHFPDAENGFTTTTAGSVASGAATVTLNSVGSYTNGMPVVLVIDPTDSTKKQTFTGIVDTAGVQITSVVWTAGTNQTHDLGATVVDYATATHIAMISKGILVSLNQDGTLKTGGAGTGVANDNLDTTAGNIGGEWLAFTCINSGVTTDGGYTGISYYTKIGKTVHFSSNFIMGATTVLTGNIVFNLPVAAVTRTGSGGVILASGRDVTTTSYIGMSAIATGTTTIIVSVPGANTPWAKTIPFTWASGDSISISGTYEVA